MSEQGGEIYTPGEGGAGVSEELSEEAKQRFAAAAAGLQQIRKEEKKAKKKDDQVARVIVHFLGSTQHTHFFVLISRLVARDCPSIFILAILSLIHEPSLKQVQEELTERLGTDDHTVMSEGLALTKTGELDAETNRALIDWIARLQMVLSLDPEKTLLKLMLDEKNLDGTVLQLTTFVIQEFLNERGRAAPFEKVQPLTVSILHTVFEPFLVAVRKRLAKNEESTR
ncbi:MAG TPA: hypothetical protein VI913_05165 [Candidatus Peribacteraceae bacterium]|nr:hypothetical protein [Candidatus Peribacteraceae bacterium]